VRRVVPLLKCVELSEWMTDSEDLEWRFATEIDGL